MHWYVDPICVIVWLVYYVVVLDVIVENDGSMVFDVAVGYGLMGMCECVVFFSGEL